MEIERKFLIKKLPADLASFPCHKIEQAYLNTNPVVRIRLFSHLQRGGTYGAGGV